MKITDLKIWVTKPAGRSFVFLRIDTDEGISGVGEASSSGGGGSVVVGDMLRLLRDSTVHEDFRESLIGEDPERIDYIWHKLYRRFTGGGGHSGFVTTLLSGIDIALWDIKGKLLNRPVYQLFGGPLRDRIALYTHVAPGDPQRAADQAVECIENGYTSIKTDPFAPEMRQHHRRYIHGTISDEGADLGIRTVEAMRNALGPAPEILIDCHGNFNVPTAIKLARRLEEFGIGWYEEPVPPDSLDALRHVKQSINIPISVGERLCTRFQFAPIVAERLAEYIMPDVLWTGGISELRKIAHLAEAFYIPVCPHDANGPINILAGAHAMMTVPNFYKLEWIHSWASIYNSFIDWPLDVQDGFLRLSDRPGLGVELDVEFIEAHPDPDWQRERSAP